LALLHTQLNGYLIFFNLHEFLEITRKINSHENFIEELTEILSLQNHPDRISSISVLEERNNEIKVIASVGIEWKNDNAYITKVEVLEIQLRGQHIGTTLIKMVIAIARYYGASSIFGVISGSKDYRYDWYPKLGFKIYEGNKMKLEF